MEEENKNIETNEQSVVEPVQEPVPVSEPVPTPVVETPVEPVAEPAPVEPAAEVAPAEPVAEQTPVEVAPTPTEEPKKKSKLPIVLFLVLLLAFAGVAVWYFALGGNGEKTEKKAEEKQEEKQEEKKEKENEEKEEKVDYEALGKEVHDKYHKISGSAQYKVYNDKKSYNLKETTYIDFTFSKYLYEQIKNDIEPLIEKDGDYSYVPADKAREIIKKAFDELYGHVIEYSDDYFNGSKATEAICLYLGYDEEKTRYYAGVPNCGSASEITKDYEITKVENEENNLIVYESANIIEAGETKTVNSKWTYTKQADNNYYFLSAEYVD